MSSLKIRLLGIASPVCLILMLRMQLGGMHPLGHVVRSACLPLAPDVRTTPFVFSNIVTSAPSKVHSVRNALASTVTYALHSFLIPSHRMPPLESSTQSAILRTRWM